MVDSETKAWMRGPADEKAVANGCRFDYERGEFVVNWIEKYCKLYEGKHAGESLILQDDWQWETTMHMFGWVKYSEFHKREIRRFRQVSIYIAKKNKKTPTMAAWAMYLLIGDGEPGQKVFLAAKDGKQVKKNLAKHCYEMWRASPDLREICEVNLSELSISHPESRSVLEPLSSSNVRTIKAKEGLNGCLCIDETHVIDDEFISRVSRMHLSREEPMHIEVSTAGNDPASYGKRRFDYAQSVIAGDIVDQKLFAAVWAAPQNLTDEELAADPVKYGKMANPSWGYTIDPEEFIEDYEQSRLNVSEFILFKMYRLNIWANTSNPWLDMKSWAKCKREYTIEDFKGLECFGGLDLAKTRDLTSFALTTKLDDHRFRQINKFWMPEDYAKQNDHLASYLQWAADGHLVLTPGNVCDYTFVFNDIEEISKIVKLKVIGYDSYNAEQLTQRIVEELGIECIPFGQTMSNFASPTGEMERLVLNQGIEHNDNPLLNWQAGHTEVKCDANKNKRPVKRQHGDHRTIDGIVADIMSLEMAMGDQYIEPFKEGDDLFL